jgi:ABC-type branched-subunit amino acid transport system permease subunit
VTWSRENRWRAGIVIAGIAFAVLAPQLLQLFTIINLTTVIALAILALSLGLIWGYGGILCFGQTAFFGLGAYAYTIAAINFGGSTWAILVAVLVAAAASPRCSAIHVLRPGLGRLHGGHHPHRHAHPVFNLLRRTSGPEYKIGNALLGGFNGVTSPPLNVPWNTVRHPVPRACLLCRHGGAHSQLCFLLLAGADPFRARRGGDPRKRAQGRTLGYDIRLYKLAMFTIGGAVAGVAGVIFCNGVGRVSPDVFSLHNAALTIIWVIVGGRGTLIGPVLGAFGLFYLTSYLGTQGVLNNNLVLGIILIVFVLLVPRGIVPTLIRWWDGARPAHIAAPRTAPQAAARAVAA